MKRESLKRSLSNKLFKKFFQNVFECWKVLPVITKTVYRMFYLNGRRKAFQI